jgi:uncharacterized membrane protein
MNKTRVEAFTDAIVAIVMTIMALEIKIPQGAGWSALWHERSYFLAYLISFFLIVITWYNHHYLFTSVSYISKKSFWANTIWLFLMSFTPVSTGWLSERPNSKAAAYFYLAVYLVWALTFQLLAYALAHDNPTSKASIYQINLPKRLGMQLVLFAIAAVFINFWPISVLLVLGIDVIGWIFVAPENADQKKLQ